MKAFIFVALVATVAARSFDLDTLRLIKEKSLLNRPLVDDVLLKDRLINRVPLEKQIVGDIDSTVLPVDRTVISGVEGLKGIYDDVDRVLTIDEIYNTQLFRQYLQIPLFRQYIQYPSFQRYVASVYFQRFWQLPTFRQYFVNPVLFYKYIYPIVQLFNSEYTLPTNSIYGQYDNINQDFLGYQGLVDEAIYRNRNVLPYVYSNRLGYPTTFGTQYPYTTATTNYKFLLEKLYNNLLINQQPVVGDVTEVKTDVKVLPVDKKVVVEPITGEQKVVIDEPKIVDVQVDSKVIPVEKVQVPVVDSVYPVVEKNVDIVLLKQLLKYNIITPEVYEYILLGKIDLVTYLLKEKIITPEIYQYIVLGKVDLVTVLRQVLGIELTTDIVSPYVTRRDVDYDSVFNYPVNRFNTERVNRFNTERVNQYNNLFKYNTLYNNEIPTYRRNTLFNRLPLQNILGDIVA